MKALRAALKVARQLRVVVAAQAAGQALALRRSLVSSWALICV